ncbi:hypothetical protein BH23BAC3_BH23BAC3_16650 [soil metagenome]
MANRKKAIKKIFIFFLCYLPVQYALVGIVGYFKAEPWPAFVFPGFKNVYVYNGYYTINDYYLEISHKEHEPPAFLTLQEFFDDIPLSMLAGFMRSNLSEQELVNNFSDETLRWFGNRAELKTNLATEQIELVHERLFMQRKDGELSKDSTHIVSRVQLLMGD